MKLLSDAHPPYKSAWKLKAEGADGADKWLAERLEEGYVLHSASGEAGSHQSCLRCGCLRYLPRSVVTTRRRRFSLVNVCNE